MRVADVMSRFIHTIEATATIGDAARAMGIFDVGVLPVVEGGRVIGIVTDRDLCVRGMGEGLHPGTSVSRAMSTDVRTCRENEPAEDVLDRMSDEQIRRMPVCARSGELVGIVSLADLARNEIYRDDITVALRDICRPDGSRSQRLRVA